MEIIRLNNSTKGTGTYGNKATALLKVAEKLNTPDGFILSDDFFKAFMANNNIHTNNFSTMSKLDQIRDAILDIPFHNDLLFELTYIYNQLQKQDDSTSLIVRSSSLLEDRSESSFAGRFDSFVNITSFDEMVLAVRKCYLSLFNDFCISKILAGELDARLLSMGVIIQKYLSGDVSGVMFTADTVKMDEQVICVNYSQGTCNQFMSGEVQSFLIKIDKKTTAVIEKGPNDTLLNEIKDALCCAAKICEELFGTPQDIEWTWFDNRLYILQSRNITTLKTQKPTDEWQIEPDLGLTWRLEGNNPVPRLRMELEQTYMDNNNFGAYTTGYEHHYHATVFCNGYQYIANPTIKNREQEEQGFYIYLSHLHEIEKNVFVDILLPHYQTLINRLHYYNKQELSPVMLSEYLKDAVNYLKLTSKTHWIAIHGRKYRNIFYKYCLNVIPEIDISDFYDLVFVESVLHTKRNMIVEMVEIAYADENIINILQTCRYDNIAYQRIQECESAAARLLIKLIAEYCEKYISFGTNNNSFPHLTLKENSIAINDMRHYLNRDNCERYKNTVRQSKENKERILNIITNKLNNEELEVFKRKLALAEKAYITSEDHNFYIECQQNVYLEHALSNITAYFIKRGWIKECGDINHFSLNEIYLYLHENIKPIDLEVRKTEYERQTKLLPPREIKPVIPAPKKTNGEAKENTQISDLTKDETMEKRLPILCGVSGYHGCATGKLFFGLPYENNIENEKRVFVLYNGHDGDITPFLHYAAGILFEEGSPFDHIGIITREFGIPAIYYLKDSIKLLNADDVVEIDGTVGKVIVVERTIK